jgi:hypothetical protein
MGSDHNKAFLQFVITQFPTGKTGLRSDFRLPNLSLSPSPIRLAQRLALTTPKRLIFLKLSWILAA